MLTEDLIVAFGFAVVIMFIGAVVMWIGMGDKDD